jgi:uncharacterized membrane protein (UPF0127 family)
LLRARNITRDSILGDTVRVADRFLPRLKGLLLAREPVAGEGLWIHPCSMIHSFGMRFEFDAIFLGPEGKVVGRYERFGRNRISGFFRTARGVLELPAGTIAETATEVGDEVRFEP